MPDSSVPSTLVPYGLLSEFLGNDTVSVPSQTVRTSVDDVASMLFGLGLPGLVSITRFGAKVDGVTDDSAAVNSAIASAKSDNLWLWNPGPTKVQSNLLDVHDVEWLGPGWFYRDSGGGVTDTFKTMPGRTDTNNLYSSPAGDANYDGLSASFPRLVVQDLINAIGYRRFKGLGDHNIILASGTYTGQTVSFQEFTGVGGDYTLTGPVVGLGTNPNTGNSEFMTNTQPLTIFDGFVDDTIYNPVVATTTFNLGFVIYPNDVRTLRVFVGGLETTDDGSDDGEVTSGFTLVYGPLIGGAYSSAQIVFDTAINGTSVKFEIAYDIGANVNDSNTVRLKHIEFKNFSTAQVKVGNSRCYTDNVWRTGGNVGQYNLNGSFWDNLGGVIQSYRKFGIQELFHTSRNTKRAKVLDANNIPNLALSRARGLWVRTATNVIALHGKEHPNGHFDYSTLTDVGVPVYLSRGGVVNMTGAKIVRPTDVPWVLFHGSFLGGGYTIGTTWFDASFGTADKPIKSGLHDRTSGYGHQEQSTLDKIDIMRGLAGKVPEISGSFPRQDISPGYVGSGIQVSPFSTNATTTPGTVVTDFGSYPYGDPTRIGEYDEFEWEGEKTGTANTGQNIIQVAGTTVVTITLPANNTFHHIRGKMVVLDSAIYGGAHVDSQLWIFYIEGDGTGLVTRVKATSAITFGDLTQRYKRLYARVANAGDSMKVNYAIGKTTARRTPEAAQ
jgi:hypothetical protein